ncbi:MAG: hypothetical protein ACO3PI_02790, partial [Burkholderiaceae bacterium]
LDDERLDTELPARLSQASKLKLPAELKAALLLSEARGPLRDRLPKKVEEWIALLPLFLNLQGLLNAPNAWPEKLTAWASSADVFRRPERLEAMGLLGQLLLADQGQATTQKLHARWGQLISLCK